MLCGLHLSELLNAASALCDTLEFFAQYHVTEIVNFGGFGIGNGEEGAKISTW